MTDYTDLKARLAFEGDESRYIQNEGADPAICLEALAAITALEADIARLQTAHVQMQRAHEDLAAENARLREYPRPTVALSKRQLFSHVVTPVVTHDDGSQTMIDQSGNGQHHHIPAKE